MLTSRPPSLLGITSRFLETCALYGVDKLESSSNKDDESIASVDSGKDSILLQDRVNSQLFISRESSLGKSL